MKPYPRLLILLNCSLLTSLGLAADLKQSKFTQIVNDVKILAMPAKTQKPAAVDELFKSPDILRTGPASRAELVASDRTITRVGANSIFSFDAASRTLTLEEGSVLFHSPKGKGGGTIRTTAAAASVLGTTIIVTATANGGFKLIVVEHRAKATLPNGKSVTLKEGQMVFVLPGATEFGPVINFRLDFLAESSLLVKGFNQPLPSMEKIQTAIERQAKMIERGDAEDTGMLVGDKATQTEIQVVDANLVQSRFEHNSTHDSGPGIIIPPIIIPPITPTLPDILINSSTLNPALVQHFPGPTFPPPHRHLIEGNNVQFQTANVDMNPYGSELPRFDFTAAGVMSFLSQSALTDFHFTLFTGLPANGELHLSANSLSFPANVNYGVDFHGSGGFYIDSATSVSLGVDNAISIGNDLGPVIFTSGGDIFFDGGNAITLNGSPATSGVDLFSTPSSASPSQISITAGQTFFMSSGAFNAASLNITAGNEIDMDLVSFIDTVTINLTAANMLELDNPSFFTSTLASINLSADTIVLQNVNFPATSTVNLETRTGIIAANVNTGAAVQLGQANFFSGVTYNGVPLTDGNVGSFPINSTAR